MKTILIIAALAAALPAAAWAAPNVSININGVVPAPPLPPAPPGVHIYFEGERPYYVERGRRIYVRGDHRGRGHRYKHHEDRGRGHAYGRHK